MSVCKLSMNAGNQTVGGRGAVPLRRQPVGLVWFWLFDSALLSPAARVVWCLSRVIITESIVQVACVIALCNILCIFVQTSTPAGFVRRYSTEPHAEPMSTAPGSAVWHPHRCVVRHQLHLSCAFGWGGLADGGPACSVSLCSLHRQCQEGR